MQTTRVAAVSMNGFLGQPWRVLEGIARWCEQAVAEKAELVLFPELVVHGHCTPNTWDLAEPVPDGPSVRALIELARRFRLVLCVGFSEKERDVGAGQSFRGLLDGPVPQFSSVWIPFERESIPRTDRPHAEPTNTLEL